MEWNKITFRKIQRTGVCRGCFNKIERGSDIFYTRNSQSNLILCITCADTIKNIMIKRDNKMDKQL